MDSVDLLEAKDSLSFFSNDENNIEEEVALNWLEKLEEVEITKDELKETKIGIVIGGIVKNKKNSKQLRRAAFELQNKWKRSIKAKSQKPTKKRKRDESEDNNDEYNSPKKEQKKRVH